MSLPPLTHHAIVRLVEPFARQGRLVDLAATDRTARCIHFQPRDLPADASGAPACRERLTLECVSDTFFCLRRTLTPVDGPPDGPPDGPLDGPPDRPSDRPPTAPAATVGASGRDPGDLLARALAVPVTQLFSAGPGWRVVRCYDTELPRGARLARGAPRTPPLVLTRAELQAGGLALALRIKLPGLRSVAADLTLTAAVGPLQQPAAWPALPALPALPEDLLAVLGWDWARLVRDKQGWTSKLRLRGPVLRRSRTAEQALDRAGAHLAHVLGGPPGRFHTEHWVARWGVVLRRGLPSLTAVFMVLGALLLTRMDNPSHAGMLLALHYLPIALLAVAFSLQELPKFEIPPLPRRSRAARWRDGVEVLAQQGQKTRKT